MAWRNREPPLYASQVEMPPEIALVFRHLVNWEEAAKKGDEAFAVARKDTQDLIEKLMPGASANFGADLQG